MDELKLGVGVGEGMGKNPFFNFHFPLQLTGAHRGFTLLEILTVVAIIAIMVTASVVSVRQGQGAARIRGATRDIFATIRHARSMALVSQQASVITYSCTTDKDSGEAIAKIAIETAKMFNDNAVKVAETLEGEKVNLVDDEPVTEDLHKAYTVNGEDPTVQSDFKGQTVEDVLFTPISEDVLRGIRIKVTKEGETLDGYVETRTKPKISVFSNVDYILGKYKEKKTAEQAKKAEEQEKASVGGSANEDQEEVSIMWEANGRTEPHRVWIFADGTDPEKGLSIKIDRFGGAKVIGAGERDE